MATEAWARPEEEPSPIPLTDAVKQYQDAFAALTAANDKRRAAFEALGLETQACEAAYEAVRQAERVLLVSAREAP